MRGTKQRASSVQTIQATLAATASDGCSTWWAAKPDARAPRHGRGQRLRRSLARKPRNWRSIASGDIPQAKAKPHTVAQAVDMWLSGREQEQKSNEKPKLMTKKLLAWCSASGAPPLSQFQ